MKKVILITILLSTFVYSNAGDWVAKINDKTISKKEFSSIYNTQLSIMEIMSNYQLDVNKFRKNRQHQQQFIEEYVANKLLIKKIKKLNKKKKFVKSKWVKLMAQKIAQHVEDQMYLKNYMDKILSKKIGKVSDKDIEKVYNKYKSKFKNVSVTKAASIIRKKLKQQKAMMLLAKLRERAKNEASIKINYDYFEN